MPNGYSEAMAIFTKILRPVFGYLKQSECLENIEATVNLLIILEFKINEQKSILKPN